MLVEQDFDALTRPSVEESTQCATRTRLQPCIIKIQYTYGTQLVPVPYQVPGKEVYFCTWYLMLSLVSYVMVPYVVVV